MQRNWNFLSTATLWIHTRNIHMPHWPFLSRLILLMCLKWTVNINARRRWKTCDSCDVASAVTTTDNGDGGVADVDVFVIFLRRQMNILKDKWRVDVETVEL